MQVYFEVLFYFVQSLTKFAVKSSRNIYAGIEDTWNIYTLKFLRLKY
jgi:hypothetical protein